MGPASARFLPDLKRVIAALQALSCGRVQWTSRPLPMIKLLTVVIAQPSYAYGGIWNPKYLADPPAVARLDSSVSGNRRV